CVRVHPDAQVEVVVPRGTSRQHVSRFLAEHESWIARRLARLPLPKPEVFPPEALELTAVGECWRIHVAAGRGRTRLQVIAPGLLQLRGALDRADDLRRVLRRWVIEHGRAVLTPRVHARAALNGLAVSAVQVRTQRTRWGSCSHRRVICLNAAVLFQPPRVLDYLIAHELGHLRHMNHSAAFWRAVEGLEPDWRTLDRELLRGWERVPAWFRQRPTEDA
ncbi:MAG: M48 family peptidase, partial [Proteobacteria bacterium]